MNVTMNGLSSEKLARIGTIAKIVCDYYRVPLKRIQYSYTSGRVAEAKRMLIFLVRTNELFIGYITIAQFLKAESHVSVVKLYDRFRSFYYDDQQKDDLAILQIKLDKIYRRLPKIPRQKGNWEYSHKKTNSASAVSA